MLLHAVQAAYYNLMPPGCFPFALLFLNCDPRKSMSMSIPPKPKFGFGIALRYMISFAIRCAKD